MQLSPRPLGLALLAAALAGAASAAPIQLRYRDSGQETHYRSVAIHQEALLHGTTKQPLKDLRVSQELIQVQVLAEDGTLAVTAERRPVAARLDGKKVALEALGAAMVRYENFRMDTLGRRVASSTGWSLELPGQPVEVGAVWTQRIPGPDGADRTLRCRLARVEHENGRTVARLHFQSRDDEAGSGVRGKWRIRGSWSFDVDQGVLLASEVETTLVARYARAVEGGADGFLRRVVHELRRTGATSALGAAD